MDIFNLFLLIAILMGIYTYYEGMQFSSLIIYLSLFALLILYFGGKQYLRESFEADMGPSIIANNQGTPVKRSDAIRLGTSTGSAEDILYMDQETGKLSDKPTETEVSMTDIIKPFAMTPINSLAEYDDPVASNMLLSDLNPDSTEVDAVAGNEGEKGQVMSDEIKNAKMLNRKFEWSNNLPPNSIVQQIQQASWQKSDLGLTAGTFKPTGGSDADAVAVAPQGGSATTEGFACGTCDKRKQGFANCQKRKEGFANCQKRKEGFANCQKPKQGFKNRKAEGFIGTINGGAGGNNTLKKAGDIYSDINGSNLEPVDLDMIEAEERKILQTFQPTRSGSELGTYNPDDVAELLDKYYSKKGQQATYYKREDGTYEVFEVEELEPEIQYEDEAPQPDRASEDMTNQIAVPSGVTKYAATLDPFFEPRQSTRPNRQDYTAWTPGLERMFAPTEPKEAWY